MAVYVHCPSPYGYCGYSSESSESYGDELVSIRTGGGLDPDGRCGIRNDAVEAGEVVVEEYAMSAIHQNKKDCISCQFCFKFLVNAKDIHNGMGREDVLEYATWLCECGEIFCSEICANESYRRGHGLLCTGEFQSEDSPLVKFKLHAINTDDLFLLAGKIYARVITEMNSTGTSFERVWEIYYKDFAPRCGSLYYGEGEDFDEETFQNCEESLRLLRAALGPAVCNPDEVDSLFCIKLYGSLLEKLTRNNIGIRIKNPFASYVDKLSVDNELLKLIASTWTILDDTAEKEEEDTAEKEDDTKEGMSPLEFKEHIDELFPCVDGEGLFSTGGAMNHSCSPNTRIKFGEDNMIQFIAVRDIAAGEEITYNYIAHLGEEVGLKERQEALADTYRFECRCPKCLTEIEAQT
mmetsp:Transcript_16450/g.28505  ORF Transcript_16450/g.28505 Transcript_16450/m.28505 type:complete len:408 (-) Transcript_16450:1164-2387(-)